MSVIIPRSVAFGNSKTGLSSVGMTLLNPDGTEHTARTTAGIYEMGGGGYGKNITFPDNWKGILKWDSGEGTPVYAYEDYNYLEMRGDKTGYELSSAGILAIWHQLTANIVTANTMGKLLKDDIDATISSRSSHSAANVWSAGSRELSTPANYKADVSSLALEATLTTMKGATYVEITDSLEAIRNRGDSAWLTATGFSTHTAANVWAVGTRELTDKAGFGLSSAAITAIWDKDISAYIGAKAGTYLKTIYDDWLNAGRLDLILDAIAQNVGGINGAAMRGTNTAALASVCTEGRLSELDAANIPSDIGAILTDTGTDGVVVASGSKSGYALSEVGIDAILDEVVEDTTTFRQMLRLFLSVLAGKSSGGGTVTLTFRDLADSKNRITATVDANGNRTTMVLDGT